MKKLSEFDFVYISYDEPNAEGNWADLLRKVPWAKRVHGVKGFDSAHKAAADKADTNRFVTVDGDSILHEGILDFVVDETHLKENDILSFSSRNNINGLMYGNGGLKCWPKQFVLDMKTHENSDSEQASVDFCWYANYIQFNEFSCISYQNGSAYQAFRSGFREGVKMSLDEGYRVKAKEFKDRIHKGNYDRLLIWSTIGRDVEYGEMAIYGARLGCKLTVLDDWNIENIRDYGWFQDFWNNTDWIKEEQKESKDIAIELKKNIGLELAEYDADQSKFFKTVYISKRNK